MMILIVMENDASTADDNEGPDVLIPSFFVRICIRI